MAENAVAPPSECAVCCSNLNQTTRRLVSCDFCPYVACLACTKTYILSTVHQPHCMNCRKEWSIDMMNKHFPKTFLRDEYRKMRETILFEEEKTYLPPLQAEAERIMTLAKLEKEERAVQKRVAENHANEDQLVRDQRIKQRALETELSRLYTRMGELRYRRRATNTEVKKFVMKCTVGECRGFLSEKYVCGLCTTAICKDCHAVLPASAIPAVLPASAISAVLPNPSSPEVLPEEEVVAPTHVCDPDEVATITELNRSTKPCPKCHVRIFKTEGCDQMFCISCHTAFSWRTGEVELGVIHNPHYFQALREGNIQDPRHRQDHGGCGPMPSYHVIYAITRSLTSVLDRKLIETYYQQFLHHRQVTLVNLAHREDRTRERIKYLIGEVDEKTFKQKLYVSHQHSLRKREERQIIESYVTIGEELFRTITHDNHWQMLGQMNTLRDVTYKAINDLDSKYQHAGHIRAKELLRGF
jgi:hypothetical protein